MALIHFMRLSLMKGAHADLSNTAWQEIGVKPYFGLSGIPLRWTASFLRIARSMIIYTLYSQRSRSVESHSSQNRA